MSEWRLFESSQFAANSALEDKTAETNVFIDREAMKMKVRENLFKEAYDVTKFYKEYGIWQMIAKHPLFDKITLMVIAINAVWIGVDTDWNSAEILMKAAVPFQIAEHIFCLFFSFEWTVRYNSFQRIRDGLHDGWFVFDSVLVSMMVFETWFLTLFMVMFGGNGSSGIGNASVLRLARLARLSRMARMARLLRAMPELMILIKGMVTATRSVFFTLTLLVLLLYVFAIGFVELTDGTEVGNEYFGDIPASMHTLLVCGTLMDNIGAPLVKLGLESYFLAVLYVLFVLFATITVMNMLIGVLCDVVSTVAAVEKEQLAVTFVKGKLQKVLESMDQDGNGIISKDEFSSLMENREACESLNEVGVDVVGLIELVDVIFDGDMGGTQNSKDGLTFGDFMDIVFQFRGNNLATVKDVVDFHKLVKQKLNDSTKEMRDFRECLQWGMDGLSMKRDEVQFAWKTQPAQRDACPINKR